MNQNSKRAALPATSLLAVLAAALGSAPAVLHAQTPASTGASSPGAALSQAAGRNGAAVQPFAAPPQASTPAGTAPLPAPAPSTATAPPVRGLPAGSPSLAIAGGTYSEDPAQRFLIVNGQVVREGADLGGGVRLSAIRPDSAVLAVQGRTVVVFF